jgi:tRNA threonylcarbamoyladenosine biosynthesis protein TsaE
MRLPFETIVNSEQETANVVESFSSIIKPGNLIALIGNLGTGKTFFVKKFCELNNITDADSPTFSIVNEYRGEKLIFHFDFYRINKIEELYDIGIDEYIYDEEAVKYIEWADLMPQVLPSKYFKVEFEFISKNSRKIKITEHE